MDFQYSARCQELQERLLDFMRDKVLPNEHRFHDEVEANRKAGNPWQAVRFIEELKQQARAAGLWNLFLPHSTRVPEGLSNLDYAPLCEIMGQIVWAPEIFNCSAPDTGNMEILERYGSEDIKRRWLDPMLRGEFRSAFAMTEPDVASSDATNVALSIRRDDTHYVLNGRKWWTSGAGDPRCRVYIVLGRSDPDAPRHAQHSMIVVPADTPGVSVVRPLSIMGYDDAPHGHMEVLFEDVRVPADNMLLGEGRGFEIAQGRLGPGRIHHCMRSIGVSERALRLMCQRLTERVAFGKTLASQSVWHERIAESRCMIDQLRLLTLKAAHMMDTVGNKVARAEIAMIKVIAPTISCRIIDWAIQAHGGGGMSGDFPLAYLYAYQRSLRLADGPDEVHRDAIARIELGKYRSDRNDGAARTTATR
jgi:acyl-CoA dehydrogenase